VIATLQDIMVSSRTKTTPWLKYAPRRYTRSVQQNKHDRTREYDKGPRRDSMLMQNSLRAPSLETSLTRSRNTALIHVNS